MGTKLATLTDQTMIEDDLRPPPAKRRRLEVNTCSEDTTIKTKGESAILQHSAYKAPYYHPPLTQTTNQALWAGLPYVPLYEIFRCLSNRDKHNAALVCRAWQLPLSRPALWRRGNFRFDGVDDGHALCFVSVMGDALRHVVIDCSPAHRPRPYQLYRSADNLKMFLTALLNTQNVHVVSFSLTNLRSFERQTAAGEPDFTSLLVQFLERQRDLAVLELGHARLDCDAALNVLTTVACAAGQNIHSLRIEELTERRRASPTQDSRLVELLARFTSLTELGLSHKNISDDLLFLLASTVSSTLVHIRVHAEGYPRVHRQTTPEAWLHLRRRCPRLQAYYTLKEISHDGYLKEVLTPSIPLHTLQWSSGGYTTMVNTKNCFNHIKDQFGSTLRDLRLDLYYAFFDDEEDLTDIVDSCQHLDTLTLTSELIQPQRRLLLVRAVRRAVSSRPRSQLKHVTVNGQSISLKETWASALIGWIAENI